MKYKNYSLILVPILIALVIFSGCVNIPVNSNEVTPAKKTYSSDVITISDLRAIPDKVSAGTDFTVSFLVKHIGDPKASDPAKDVSIILYDWGLCKPKEQTGNVITIENLKEMVPEQEEQILIDFQAPTNKEIAKMEYTCPIRFKVSYKYQGKTQVDVKVIDENTKKDKIRLGTYTVYTPTQTQGQGPIKINFNFYSQQPFDEKNKYVFKIFLTNSGKGQISKSYIEKGKLTLEYPKDFKGMKCDMMDCSSGKCTLKENLQFIGEKSQSIRCSFETPDVEDEKTYYMTAYVDYTYEVYAEQPVTVEPIVEE